MMKKIILLIIIHGYVSNSIGQLNDGRKILTISAATITIATDKNVSTQNSVEMARSKGTGVTILPELSFGRIHKGHLLSYGLQLFLNFNKSKIESDQNPNLNIITHGHTVGIAPLISYQKFLPLVASKLYYSPYGSMVFGYKFNKLNGTGISEQTNKGIYGSLVFRPFSIIYIKTAKTNFVFNIGNISIDYDRMTNSYTDNPNGVKTVSSNLSLSSALGSIVFGIQKTF